jgi:hypothetical protein
MGRARQSPLAAEEIDPVVAEHEEGNAIVREKLATLDALIERVQSAPTDADRDWRSVPSGGRLELRWPLPAFAS